MLNSGLPSDPTVSAAIAAMVAKDRAAGLADDAIRRRILDDLQAALPERAVDGHNYKTVVAGWQRAVDEALGRSV